MKDRRFRISYLLAPILALLVACGGGENSVVLGEKSALLGGETISHRPSQIMMPRMEVIEDDAAWVALWEEHHEGNSPIPPLPVVDFSTKVVVVVIVGGQPTGCYGVTIQGLETTVSGTTVYFRERHPNPGDICTASITSPAHMVAVPKTEVRAPYTFVATN